MGTYEKSICACSAKTKAVCKCLALTSTYKPLEHMTPDDSEYKLGTDMGESSFKRPMFLLNI